MTYQYVKNVHKKVEFRATITCSTIVDLYLASCGDQFHHKVL